MKCEKLTDPATGHGHVIIGFKTSKFLESFATVNI